MTNKSIIFPTTIKLKTIELKVNAMLDTRASKNFLFEILVLQEDQQTLVQPVELVQYNQQKQILTKYISNVPIRINNITLLLPPNLSCTYYKFISFYFRFKFCTFFTMRDNNTK